MQQYVSKEEVTSNGKSVILKADRALLGRVILIAQHRRLQMSEVLSHPFGPLPCTLATSDGVLRKTEKARHLLTVCTLPDKCVSVIDGMSLVQKVKGDEVMKPPLGMF